MLAKHLKIYGCSLPFFSLSFTPLLSRFFLFSAPFFSPPPQATFTLSCLGQTGSLHVT